MLYLYTRISKRCDSVNGQTIHARLPCFVIRFDFVDFTMVVSHETCSGINLKERHFIGEKSWLTRERDYKVEKLGPVLVFFQEWIDGIIQEEL